MFFFFLRFFFYLFYVFPAALGVGDKGTSKGGSDHEDAIWLSFVRDWP
jgi:hypothetical protein